MGTDGEPRLLCTLDAADGVGSLRLEDHYETDVEDLWSAITDPARLARWYGVVTGDLRVGGSFDVVVTPSQWKGSGTVDVCEPTRHLRVTTRESAESRDDGTPGPSEATVLDVTLTAGPGTEGGSTLLVAEISGLPLEPLGYYGAGWQEHAEHLADEVAGRTITLGSEARFMELAEPYLAIAAALAGAPGTAAD